MGRLCGTAVSPSRTRRRLHYRLLMCMMRTMKSSDLIRELGKAGWRLDRVRGSHHVSKHPVRAGHVMVPHPEKDLSPGLVGAIRKQAGL